MKNIFFAILLFAIIICGRGETIPTTTDNGVFSSLATKHVNLINSNTIKVNLEPDSTTISSIPDYLYKVLCVNNYLPGICDTVQCAIGLLGGETSSHIVEERRGVSSARKFESFFHYVSPTSTITKNGRPYALSAEDMKQIYNLYAMWWRKILCCDNLVEMEGLLSSNPLEGSPYGWKEAQGWVTPFKSANDKKLFK